MIVVKDGKAHRVNSNITIPKEHLNYRTMPPDGFYKETEATCGGKCSIGKPKKDCIDRCYSPDKCAVLYLDKIE